ncbi:hypothetical protein NDU88_006713 [Pleurodeles waltl]|uniref:Uncharacterized protein n=1 Tax=Pleurodeles waltl TaxID=8319 RepID=A0AAV7SQL2_PLEWA|nr:hypothetical protein NDU88_006713 [Pleurodeles waltl]
MGPAAVAVDLAITLQDIQASKEAVVNKISKVRVDMALLGQDLHNVTSRVSEGEGRVSTLEDEVTTLEFYVTKITTTAATMEPWAKGS